jgi:hypothetical protein
VIRVGSAQMPRKPSTRGPGRPSLGKAAHTRVVPVKMSELEYSAIAKAVAAKNKAAGDDAKPGTVSSWIREHALAPLGLR